MNKQQRYTIKTEFQLFGNTIGQVFVVSDIMLEHYKVSEVLIKKYIKESIRKTIETLIIQGAINLNK